MNTEEPTITIDFTDIPLSDFKEMSEEEQVEAMRDWFFENYEDPAHRTPYESREGGYIYIWGGPYNAYEELSIFYGYIPDEIIEDLAHDLSMDCPEWTSAEKPSDYEDSYFNLILSDNEYFKSFMESINHIRDISNAEITGATKDHLLRVLHVSVITAIETYLSDAFINSVINDRESMRKFVENNPEFKNKTIKLSEIFAKHENIDQEVKGYLVSQLWHNLKKIKPMYKTTLGVDFPDNIESIFKAIDTRHDLVHRNGKNIDGEAVIITDEILSILLDDAIEFITYINEQLEEDDTDF